MDPRKVFQSDKPFVPSVYTSEKHTSAKHVGNSLPRAMQNVAKVQKVRKKKSSLTVWVILRRTLLSVVTVLVLAVTAVLVLCGTIANGPSPTVRNLLVLSAMQASATKWVPGLFLEDSIVEQILADSAVISTDVISLADYTAKEESASENAGEDGIKDEWANAQDGMLFDFISGSTYKAYVLVVKDPSRIFVGTSSDYKSGQTGVRIFDIAAKENAVAAINAGEFYDVGGQGTGDNPIGLTYSKGECVWNDGARRTFIGFDQDNRLVVSEKMTYEQAETLNIRDAVSFQTGNVLIDHTEDKIQLYYADSNTGTAQRTAIGQRADGAVILLVTDGRSASSLGATHNDVIDIMVSYGAVTAAMLDGGSSSMMYYENYYKKYGINESTLDQYQLKGLVNKYKAFTSPRRMPTFFVVAREAAS